MMVRLDAAVIGSGPAGCAVAIHLRKAGIRTTIVTLTTRPARRNMPETLPPGVCGTALWPVTRLSLRPLYAMASAWGSASLTTRHAITNPLGHGWFVDRPVFDREMLNKATQDGAVPIIHGRISSVSKTRQGWLLEFSRHPPVEAAVVVDASGRSAAFARQIGVRRIALDRLVSINARAAAVNFPTGEALLESSEAGWWFSTLTSRGEMSVSFFAGPARLSFADALRSTVYTSQRVLRLLPGRLQSLPARTDRLEIPADEGWLAVGDAAFASDPLASQGLLRALSAAQKAAEIIACDSTRNPRALEEYCEFHLDHVKRFLRERHFFYGMEQRWPEAPFWKTAQAPARFL